MRSFVSTVSTVFLMATILFGLMLSPAHALNQTYQVYVQGSHYYLKTDPNWVPISGDIFIIIPIYHEGEILKLSQVDGVWDVENVSFSQFSAANPLVLTGGALEYADFNGDGVEDLAVSLGASEDNQTIQLISSPSQRVFTPFWRRVMYIHTDLLGSPAAETDDYGNVQ